MKQRSDPATFNPSQHRRPPSTARMHGSCEYCSEDIHPGDPIQRVKQGREVHVHCAGKE